MTKIINQDAINNRKFWIEEIRKLSGNFGNDSDRLETELNTEIKKYGTDSLLGHLRLCGDLPESYSHDSSEEKLYSKYTDSILSETYKHIGLKSIVIKERADAADVEAFATDYSFVADAKAFRLSRTAKNQKDFKVQAMDGWKRDKPFAMVVCPIYQLPVSSSQIYQQASSRNVCIFTYSHLAVLVSYAKLDGNHNAEELLHQIFKAIPRMNPTKDASSYWIEINKTILNFSKKIDELWKIEKIAAIESIVAAKEEALTYLSKEREKIIKLSHEEAIKQLIKAQKIDSKIQTIKQVTKNNLLDFGENNGN